MAASVSPSLAAILFRIKLANPVNPSNFSTENVSHDVPELVQKGTP